MTDTLQKGEFASLVSDVKGVNIYLILELAMDSGRSRLLRRRLTFVHVPTPMLSRLHSMDFYPRLYSFVRWFGSAFPLQRRRWRI